MPDRSYPEYTYTEKDLRDAAEFRKGIHREALGIARLRCPGIAAVTDRHPAEDYFRLVWDYPGAWYLYVSIPEGYRSRDELIGEIVRDTVAEYRRKGRIPPEKKRPAD